MWGLMKQQVFLGMAASSVPVKPGVPNMVEDLMASGVRFVYYSPRNMRRSKVSEAACFTYDCARYVSLPLSRLAPSMLGSRRLRRSWDWRLTGTARSRCALWMTRANPTLIASSLPTPTGTSKRACRTVLSRSERI